MKRTLLMVMAVALLLTQCRKPAVELPTAGPANENMVSMTVTVGHGGKTDISETDGITWSTGDRIYVGHGGKYAGCLTLQSGAGSATGTFSGSVSTTSSTTFGLYYLGSNPPSVTSGATSVDISFASQTGFIGDLSDCHIGYGTAKGKVEGTSVILDSTAPVTMTSKVAIAYFEFKDGETPYEGAITLSGTNICNSMTVGFNGSFSGTTGTAGKAISLTNTSSSQKYVMLVPTGTGEETLEFGGGAEGSTKFYKGIEANKFYCVGAGDPIEVTVTKPKFSVAAGTTVEFAPGNLYWDGGDFRFEADQWDFRHYKGKTGDAAVIGGESTTTPAGTVGSFFWSKTASVAYASSYSDSESSASDVFFTNSAETTANPDFHVNGETAGTWRTLSAAESDYLLNTRSADASSLWAWVDLTDVNVSGLVILPDGSSATASNINTSSALAASGAVFLPAAGVRPAAGVAYLGTHGFYWVSAPWTGMSDPPSMWFYVDLRAPRYPSRGQKHLQCASCAPSGSS